MKLPDRLLREQVDQRISRGSILRLELDRNILRDPNRPTRFKFAIVLNTYCPPEGELWFVLTTSNTVVFDKNPQFERDIIRLASGEYGCFQQPVTIVNGRDLESLPMDVVRALYESGKLEFHGVLKLHHLQMLDAIVRESLSIAPEKKRHVGEPDKSGPA